MELNAQVAPAPSIPDWLVLLKQAVGADPRGAAGVAECLDVSRTTVSLVVNGKYPASPRKIAAKVLDTYARVDCPHLGESVTVTACRGYADRQAPTHNPHAMHHWRACQACPLRPAKLEGASNADE